MLSWSMIMMTWMTVRSCFRRCMAMVERLKMGTVHYLVDIYILSRSTDVYMPEQLTHPSAA